MINKNYALEKNKIERNMLVLEKENSNLKDINTKIDNIKRELKELGIKDEIIENTDYKKIFELQIIEINKDLINDSNLLSILEMDLKKYKDTYDESERIINIKKIQIEAVMSQEKYVEVQNCLDKLEMEFDYNKINNEFIVQSTEIKNITKDNKVLSTKIEELTNETSQYKYEEIITEIDTTKAEIETKFKFIDEYEKIYKKHSKLNCEDIQLQQVSDMIKNADILRNVIERKKENVNLIIENIGYITENEARINLINKNKIDVEKQRKIKETLDKLNTYKDGLEKVINVKVNLAFNSDCINSIYRRLEPHPNMNNIKFVPDFVDGKPTMNIYTYSDEDKKNMKAPILYFSAAQVNILSLSIFFAKALQKSNGLETIFMDEPVQHLDSINILSFVDLIRTVAFGKKFNRQMIISTSNSNFYNIIKRKLDSDYYNSKFIELESYGKILRDI
ncbi:hypothetical protein [Clostridium sp. DL-VIII]|uniref:hypothetical protein n=1 Tax=Clostridium sp. DL-VIII TaxID=641107 RepID=UPI0005570B18|nr:hypothetical protein [Clostridium sp. DL-VIII]